jgi:hypothetical protein
MKNKKLNAESFEYLNQGHFGGDYNKTTVPKAR